MGNEPQHDLVEHAPRAAEAFCRSPRQSSDDSAEWTEHVREYRDYFMQRSRDAIRFFTGVHAEQRRRGDAQRQFHHLRVHVELALRGLPTSGVLAHDPFVAGDAFAMKCGLHDAPHFSVKRLLAGHEAAAEQGAHRARSFRFHEGALMRYQDVADCVRIVYEIEPPPRNAKARHGPVRLVDLEQKRGKLAKRRAAQPAIRFPHRRTGGFAHDLSAGLFYGAALRLKIADDLVAVIALDFDDAVLCGTARAAQAFERFRDFGLFAFRKAGNQRHRTRASAFAKDAHDSIIRNARLSIVLHSARFGRRALTPRQTTTAT